MTGDKMTMILVLMAISFIVIQSINESPRKKEHIALWLSYCCTILGTALLTNTKVGLILAVLSFLVAMLFPKFRAGFARSVVKILYPPGQHSWNSRQGFSQFDSSSASRHSGMDSSSMHSSFGHDFARGYGSGASTGSPGSTAGAGASHKW
jgi:uncharacterized membrane protein YgcG